MNRIVRGELVVVIDCSDLDRSAEFWTGLLGYVRDGVATVRYQALLPADGKITALVTAVVRPPPGGDGVTGT